MRVTVIALGDLTRSPRTLFHALALAGTGASVDIIGFAPPGWHPAGAATSLTVWRLPSEAGRSKAGRGVRLGLSLFWLLWWSVPRPDIILVQNPPGVPTLIVGWLAARLRAAKFVIDWHNLTSSMLALSLGPSHPLIAVVSAYEKFLGRRADGNLFVSAAMRDALRARWGLAGSVFYDRPGRAFRRLEVQDRQAVRADLLTRLGEPASEPVLLVVTSTSWSADEDFGLLLDALCRLDRLIAEEGPPAGCVRRVVVLVTGQGPLREGYERRFAEAGLQNVGIHCAWLEAGEYPRALAAADLGVCLHRSASGLDLPMKVLDMFGAGLPVCAFDYGPCLLELVRAGTDGLLFVTSEDLALHLQSLRPGASGLNARLLGLRSGVADRAWSTWEDAWEAEVRPVLVRLARY